MTKFTKIIFLMIIISSACFNHKTTLSNSNNSFTEMKIKTHFSSPIKTITSEEIEITSDENFGDQQLFWLTLPDWIQMRATLLAEGNYCYIYMANETIELLGENESITKCEDIRDAFDEDIYPKALEVAGHPDGILGDIDGDPKITIFLAPLVRYLGSATLGYIHLENEDPGFPYTNLREMVYCDSEKNAYDIICITIHEFNHLIYYKNDWNDCEFLTEGLAYYAVDYAGYNFYAAEAVANTFTNYPEIPLLYFYRDYDYYWDASYGQAYLFVSYLADRFGNEFTKKLVSIPEDGAEAIDVALDYFDYNLTFNDIYLDWITAITLDDTTIDDGIYGYETLDYKMKTSSPIINNYPLNKTHYFYGFDIKTIYNIPDNFTFIIDNPYPFTLGISIVINDDSNWNVYQEFYYEDTDEIRIYIEGENIEDLYIITSLMSSETPNEFGTITSLDQVESQILSYYYLEGNVVNTKLSKITYSVIFFIPIALIVLIKRNHKRDN
ncbi:MAG: hypothetical protein FK734_05875 [Asgard group archaeon]|nr:hypothetical protein [Asgard group archaeon]